MYTTKALSLLALLLPLSLANPLVSTRATPVDPGNCHFVGPAKPTSTAFCGGNGHNLQGTDCKKDSMYIVNLNTKGIEAVTDCRKMNAQLQKCVPDKQDHCFTDF